MGVNLVAWMWGFAEATLFFIVPDVWLTIAGRHSLKTGMVAAGWALVDALVGGVVMFSWGHYHQSSVLQVLEFVPAVNHVMIGQVAQELRAQGVSALLFGPLQGIPYKLYAAQAHTSGIEMFLFLLVSIPARLLRFVLSVVVSYGVLKGLSALGIRLNALYVLIGFWSCFYLFYFYVMT